MSVNTANAGGSPAATATASNSAAAPTTNATAVAKVKQTTTERVIKSKSLSINKYIVRFIDELDLNNQIDELND